jgi:hypothetical protein
MLKLTVNGRAVEVAEGTTLLDAAREAGVDDAAELAHRINLLHEGAVAVAHVSADPEIAACARAMAKTLLEAG